MATIELIVDCFLAVLCVLVVLSSCDFTAWFILKIPILKMMPQLIWQKPVAGLSAIMFLLALAFYFSIKYDISPPV